MIPVWDRDNLRGNIKLIETRTYIIDPLEKEADNVVLFSSFVQHFSHDGEHTLLIRTDAAGDLVSKYIIEKDLENQWIECKCYDPRKILTETIFYQLDHQGLPMQEKCYDQCGELKWEHLFRNEDNTLPSFKIRCHYNEHGDETERQEISPSGSTNSTYFEYQYDSYNNWIARIERNGPLKNLTTIIKRVIKYHDA